MTGIPTTTLPHLDPAARVIGGLRKQDIGDGYVVHTLEASLWCLLRAGSYREAVLAAINLGEATTHTTAAVAGGLGGIVWGLEGIPATWVDTVARIGDIRALAERLADERSGWGISQRMRQRMGGGGGEYHSECECECECDSECDNRWGGYRDGWRYRIAMIESISNLV